MLTLKTDLCTLSAMNLSVKYADDTNLLVAYCVTQMLISLTNLIMS